MATEEQKSTDEERDDAEASSAGGDRDEAEGEAASRSEDAAGSDADADESGADESGADESGADESGADESDADESDADESTGAEPAAAKSDEDEDEDASTAALGAKSAAARGSAGARLAAAKAAKAAKKAARKAREQAESGTVPAGMTGGGSKPADEVLAESFVGQAASKASDWAQSNRPIALGVAAVALVALLGWAGWSWYTSSQAEQAGGLLAEAIEIANGDIEAEGSAPDEGEDDEPTFATREERAEAALAAYQRVVSEHGGTEAARWARLGVAWAHFQLGHMDEAREAYEQTFREAGGDPVVAWRALEGMGFTYEAAQQWDQAIEKYEELSHVEDGAYSAPADYHIARMHIAKGETVQATTQLRALIDRLRTESEGGEPAFPFVLAQAELRLRELDPSASGAGAPTMIGPGGPAGGGMPAGLDGLPPEILEQLRRQIQEQGAAAGGGEGGE